MPVGKSMPPEGVCVIAGQADAAGGHQAAAGAAGTPRPARAADGRIAQDLAGAEGDGPLLEVDPAAERRRRRRRPRPPAPAAAAHAAEAALAAGPAGAADGRVRSRTCHPSPGRSRRRRRGRRRTPRPPSRPATPAGDLRRARDLRRRAAGAARPADGLVVADRGILEDQRAARPGRSRRRGPPAPSPPAPATVRLAAGRARRRRRRPTARSPRTATRVISTVPPSISSPPPSAAVPPRMPPSVASPPAIARSWKATVMSGPVVAQHLEDPVQPRRRPRLDGRARLGPGRRTSASCPPGSSVFWITIWPAEVSVST